MRRIVHYYPGAMGNSGVTFALWSWARAQAAAGYDVCVMHAPADNTGADIAFVSKDRCDRLTTLAIPHRGGRRMTLRPAALDRHLGSNDLLVLHEGWVTNNIVAAAHARRASVPYIVMPHGVYDPAWMNYLKPPRWLRDRLERRVLEGAAAVHVFFDSEIADVRRLAPRANFITVPTGFDVPAAQWHGGGGYLGWVGRIDPVHKGLDVLIGAIARMKASDRPLLRIRGYDYKGGVAALQHQIAEQDLEKWVRLEGTIAGDEKTRFMQDADGYIHPSRWECHSIALLENLSMGVPCLVSSAIHIADTLHRAGAALLSPPHEDGFAAALPQLAANQPHVGSRGRALVAESFAWKTIVPQFQSALGAIGLQ
jgi:glycosyltransferase involved in cell wall biosynthesis